MRNQIPSLCFFRYKKDLWLWDLDWSVQDVRLKKTKPPKKSRKKKANEEELTKQMNDNENNEEQDVFANIPLADDVLYKKRQHLPGYPR